MNKRKLIYYLIGITILSYFIYTISDKLVIGGRWSTGMLLGGVDNWLNGGHFYTIRDIGIPIGPIYGPGGVFVALFARILFGFNAETAMIVIGGLIDILTFWGFAFLLSQNNKKRLFYFFLCFFFFLLDFSYLKKYSYELHPDMPALMCFVWGILFMVKFLESKRIYNYLLATCLFCLAGLFKANSLFLFIGLGLFSLFSNSLDGKSKFVVILSEVIAGILVLVIMFSIDGCWYNSVEVMGTHHFLSIKQYLIYLKDSIILNKLYLLFLVFSVWHFVRTKPNYNLALSMWLLPAVLWLLFGLVGTAKDGANVGNVEAAIIALMPFVVLSFERLINMTRLFVIKILSLKSYGLLKETVTSLCVCACLFLLTFSFYSISRNYSNFRQRIKDQITFSKWLNDNYKDCNIAYSSSEYDMICHSEVNLKTDLFIALHYAYGDNISDKDILKMSQDEKWDAIITRPSILKKRYPILLDYFERSKENIPRSSAGGEMADVFIRTR